MKNRKNLIWLVFIAFTIITIASCKAGDCNCPQL